MAKDLNKDTFPQEIQMTTEEIATAVAKISRGMEVLSSSRLRHKTILVLLSHDSKVPQSTISRVLDSLSRLEKTYLK